MNQNPKGEIEKNLREHQDGWLFFEAQDERMVIRALLDACTQVNEVSLDVTDLIWGGWLDEKERVCEARRRPGALPRPVLEPTAIMAEGRSDIKVLRLSLQKLFPHLTDYFSFFEHQELNVDGGANYLLKFLKAFAAARISSRIVAIFDNDTVGLQSLDAARALRLPSNIKVLRLPDIEIARSYPTIGPQGFHEVDVNGRTASIELYLGGRNLTDSDNRLRPVRWTGYNSTAERYQGAVERKEQIVVGFEKEISRLDEPSVARAQYPELASIWEMIFHSLEH